MPDNQDTPADPPLTLTVDAEVPIRPNPTIVIVNLNINNINKVYLNMPPKTPSPPPASQAHITASTPVLTVALVFAGIFGIGCIYGGIQLMSAPGSGETIFNFFGLQFSTKQAGVAAIALGAATIILTFRKVFKTLVDLGKI